MNAYAALALALFAGLTGGWMVRDLRPQLFSTHSDQMQIVIGPQSDGTNSLQLNMNGKALGWIALTPSVVEKIRSELPTDL